jgi:hypothetical protein
MKPKPNMKRIAAADDKIAAAADEMIKGPMYFIEAILRKHEQAVLEVMAEQQDEIKRLHQVCRDTYEVWAGSEGIPIPETAPEAYLLGLVEKMRDEVKRGLR